MSDLGFPTETIDLPSKGYYYPENTPLASGRIELRYMTSEHEDILTSPNLLAKGTVIDKLLQALVATPNVNYEDLLIGDKNAIFLAARILGFGKEYPCTVACAECQKESDHSVDLAQLDYKHTELLEANKGKNEFDYTLPNCGKSVTFKLLTQADEMSINKELDSYEKKVGGDVSHAATTRLRYAILAVNGDRTRTVINQFVPTMLIRDSRALRKYATSITPDISFETSFTCSHCGHTTVAEVPMGTAFFWPDA